MGKVYINNFIARGSDLVEKGYCELTDGSRITLKDQQLDKLVDRMEAFVRNRELKIPENEKEICTELVRLIHTDEFYGSYDKETKTYNSSIKEISHKIKGIKASKYLSGAQKGDLLEDLNAKLSELKARDKSHDKQRRHQQLSEYPKGTLVCLEQGLITSYVMEKLKLHNDFCADLLEINNSCHAFVQSHSTLNIIEATDPVKPYRENVNGGIVINGDIVAARSSILVGITFYGKGNVTDSEFRKAKKEENPELAFERLHKEDLKRAIYQYEGRTMYEGRMCQPFAPDKPISVEDAAKNAEFFAVSCDRGLYFFGLPIKKADGIISPDEIVRGKEKAEGGKSAIPDLMLKVYEPRKVAAFVANCISCVEFIDKNDDGKITPEEFKSQIITTDLGGKSLPPTLIQAQENYLKKIVYGINP